jgi:L-amino acid N-acyltransferase YncA
MTITLRPAQESDIPAINKIHRYYVENTVITFTTTPKTDDEALAGFKATMSSGLPYIVAIDTESQHVVGFCYSSPFRGSKGGYSHTAELTLFVDQHEQGKGSGSLLLKHLIEIQTTPSKFSEYFTDKPRRVRALLACMAVDVTARDEGLGLKKYYEKFGFTLVGNLKNVGYKLERW